jgi:hypothetical protein
MTKLDDTEDVELIEDEGETVDEFVIGKRCLRTRVVSPFAKEGQFAASAQKIKRLRMLETSISQYQNM